MISIFLSNVSWMSLRQLFVLYLFGSIFSSSAVASVVEFYTDRNLFEDKLFSANTIDFEGIVGDQSEVFGSHFLLDDVNFIADGFSGNRRELMISGKYIFGSSSIPMDSALLVANYSYPIIVDLTATGGGYNAVGGFFGDISDPLDPITMEIFGESGLIDSRNLMSASMKENTPSNFFGWIVHGEDITRLRYTLNGNYEGVDDFVYGVASPVPEAPVAFLICLGLMGFGYIRHVKR